jgi:heme A synthase
MFLAVAAYSLASGWYTALAAGGVVLAVSAAVSWVRGRRPSALRAAVIIVTTVVVGAIGMLAAVFPSSLITTILAGTAATGGAAIAAAVLLRPLPYRQTGPSWRQSIRRP